MTAPPQTNAQGQDTSKFNITEEDFLQFIDKEMVKVEKFTLAKVTEIREKINQTEQVLQALTDGKTGEFAGDSAAVIADADSIANAFLRLAGNLSPCQIS